mmetsp:Transcript_28139/g.45180  ORF Transcript_28139/g.45180 Transcript_28139/m.45180 type:complete len:209 (-) Transcript_28139:791-1417(-)
MTFSRFICVLPGKSNEDFSLPSEEGACQPSCTGNTDLSSTLNSRVLNSGERIAACKAHPLATHSSAFMVVESSFPPKAAEHMSLTHGTREAPPQISTASMADKGIPLPVLTLSSTSLTFCIMGLHISKKSARVIVLEKSWSSMRHSQETGASLFADRTFLVLPTASSNLKHAFLFPNTSQPVFFLNCSAKVRMRHSSISRPPTFDDFS